MWFCWNLGSSLDVHFCFANERLNSEVFLGNPIIFKENMISKLIIKDFKSIRIVDSFSKIEHFTPCQKRNDAIHNEMVLILFT